MLLVEDIDRLSRNAANMHRIADDLEELGIALCTVADGDGELLRAFPELDAERVAFVRRMFADLNAGRTTTDICAALNAEGVPNREGDL